MKKCQLLCLLLAAALLLPGAVRSTAFTLAETPDATAQAETLKALGLFLGTGQGFELERGASRAEAAVMLVRLLGKEAAAKEQQNAHPFDDVPEWASPHVGYLCQNGIARGVSDTAFGGGDAATAPQYGTFVLRALGYDDAAGDFSWESSLLALTLLEIIGEDQAAQLDSAAAISRGSVVALSYAALFATPKGEMSSLLEKLYAEGALTAAQLSAAAGDANVAAVTGSYLLPAAPTGEVLTSEQVFALASPCAFMLQNRFGGEDIPLGSGFFLTADGLAVTNFHVVAYMQNATIKSPDGGIHKVAGLVAADPDNDIAVIRIEGEGFPALKIGDPAALRPGQRIYCIGSPLGLDNTLSDGLVSNAARVVEGVTYIQISAPITYGSSGGPMLNEYGQVVGITSAGALLGNLNLAIPITALSGLDLTREARSMRYFEAHRNFGVTPGGNEMRETERNDTVALQTIPSDSLMFGSLSGGGDVDLYTVNVARDADVIASLFRKEITAINLKVDLLASGGTVVASSRALSGETFSLLETRVAAGTYTLRVSGINRLSYELYWFSSDANEGYSGYSITYELEPNDSRAEATYLRHEAWSCYGNISSAKDVDYYTFTLTEQVETYIDFDCEKKLTAELFNASGKLLGTANYNPADGYANEYFDELLEPGVYYLKITPNDTSAAWEEELYELWFSTYEPDDGEWK